MKVRPAPAAEVPAPEAQLEVTELLIAWRGGDDAALATLLPLVYRRMKKIAARYVRGQRRSQTLQTTALVHEAYLRLIDFDQVNWQDRTHFFAVTAQLMRRVLVDNARHHKRAKRGGGAVVLSLDEASDVPERALDLLVVDDALRDLAAADERMARIVELRFFAGLNREEISEVMNISSATVTRQWRSARAWLLRQLSQSREHRADA